MVDFAPRAMTDCAHLLPLEAYASGPDRERPITAFGWLWGDAHPDRLLDVPRWLSEQALAGGPTFQQAKHCPGCPGYRRAEPRVVPAR